MGEFITIDSAPVQRTLRAFRELPAATRKALRTAGIEAANEFADAWRSNLSYSTWQGSAVQVSAPFGVSSTVSVRLNSSKAPSPDHAPLPRLEEFGNVPGGIRHPVFGGDTWVTQPNHPAMIPAIKAKAGPTRDRLAEAVAAAARSVGLSLT